MIRLAAIFNLVWMFVWLTGMGMPVKRADASGYRRPVVNVRSRSWSDVAAMPEHTVKHYVALSSTFRFWATQGHYCLHRHLRLVGQLPGTALFVGTSLLHGLKYDCRIASPGAAGPAVGFVIAYSGRAPPATS